MNSNKKPLGIITGVVVLAIIGIVAYAASQGSKDTTDTTMPEMTSQQNSTEQSSTETKSTEQMNSVEIKDYMYAPKAITVKVGTTVTWTNQDGVKHTVTTDNDAPAKIDSELFGKGETFSYTFEKAGTYNYYCQPHPYMKGSVTVTE